MTHARYRAFAAMILLLSAGCKEVSQPLPAGMQNPEGFKTRNGALALHRGALQSAHYGFLAYMGLTGRLVDELKLTTVYDATNTRLEADRRQYSSDEEVNSLYSMYIRLQAMRNNAMQGIDALRTYAADSSALQRAELYALQGYAEVMLAEGFCSGIPLSTVDFEGDYTYQPGSSRQEVIHHAIALFDTAVTLSADSTRISYLARIGKARALLVVDSVRTAAETVAGIPDDYQYTLPIAESAPGVFIGTFSGTYGIVSDREGQNGLPFITSKDPRSASYAYLKVTTHTDSMYLPRKYNKPPNQLVFVVASGIEARLIEAESDLQTAPTQWLNILNDLRTDGTYVTSGGSDTAWNAGTGGVAGLRRLRDPATGPLPGGKSIADARIDLLFTERAYWLFLTGHRQGDLRRLVRTPYSRDAETVYPTGPYGPYGDIVGFQYGDVITLPVPKLERQLNPRYHGCLSRDA